jgi:hypothetical protein
MSLRQVIRVAAVCALVLPPPAGAQVPGQNVNMVAGTSWPGGDPFLQRQNEPSMAVSSRNPLHLLAGANDYRTVDLPGLPDGGVTGDAWLGLFKSTNGGGRWTSALVPGYPQDQSPEGLASPLKGYAAAADAVVRPGTHGLFYYGGLVFNRGTNVPSAIFVARYMDRNNKENGDPFVYLGTSIVESNSGAEFLDKPAFAVGLPRPGSSAACNIDGQSITTGPVYAAWTIFLGEHHPHSGKHDGDDDGVDDKHPKKAQATIRSRIMFSRSLDCGQTWSKPDILSGTRTNQAAAIAVDPRTGDVYVAWRQFASPGKPHAMVVRKSSNKGHSWGPRVEIEDIFPFDQGTSNTSFRTNSYPTMAIDHDGRLYLAWSARSFAPMAPDPQVGDARVVVSTSVDGRNWTLPRAVDNWPARGHQIMPAMTYVAGKVQVVYYDLREDVSGFFEQFVDEFNILRLPPGTPGKKRHTLDVRAAQAQSGPGLEFASYAVTPADPSERASQYLIGSRPGSSVVEQLQFSPPNLPLFGLGTLPFIGDYIDVAAQTIVPDGTGWRYSNASDQPIFHLVWADNRDVRPPLDGNWSNYTPPTFAGSGGPSIFDPDQEVQVCVPGQAGMRNQNIYTSRVTPGLVVGSPGNNKPLSTNLQRAFVVFAQNTTGELALYRFSVANQPVGGYASLLQFDGNPATPEFDVLAQVDVLVPPGSSAARTVFVTSTDPRAQVRVDVVQIAGGGTVPPPGGRAGTVILNPDILNPDILNPDILNPDILNPDILNAEVHNPDVLNPDILNLEVSNPDILNPDILNPDILNVQVANPDILNPDILNPDILNPDILNPDILNPDILNPDILNGSITDYSYTVTNNGNTASQYELTLEETDPIPDVVKLQLVVHRTYQTPVVVQCNLELQNQNQVLLNLPRPTEFDGLITFWLEPGESIKLTFRVVDTDRNDGITWTPTESLRVTVTAGAVNWDADTGPDPNGPASDTVRPPVAVDDQYEVEGGGTLEIAAPGVKGNDQIFGDDVPLVTLVGGPSHAASFALRADGSFSYVAAPGFVGTDSFTYVLLGPLRSNLATVTIQVTGDPLVVTSTEDQGFGSLRVAMEYANAHLNLEGIRDTITFAIPGEGATRRITLATPLPAITDPVVIDAGAQPGYSLDPMIVVDGRNLSRALQGAHGLEITSGASEVRGLAILNMPGNGLLLSGGSGNIVRGTLISGHGRNGVQIIDSSKNVIGGGSNGDRNVISGNGGEGVRIDGALAAGNHVVGNFVGLGADGVTDAGNGASGIYVRRAPANVVEDNYVSGNNGFAGIAVCGNPAFCGGGDIGTHGSTAGGTVIRGNIVGLDRSGRVAVGNNGHGVSIDGAPNTAVGGAGQGNLIAASGAAGVVIFGATASGNVVSGNRIGVDTYGKPMRSGIGVYLHSGASNNLVGGAEAEGNVIAFSKQAGVFVEGNATVGNRILGNSIFGSGDLNIDLAPAGPTPNDRLDLDAGPNFLQNFPAITYATVYGSKLRVTGTINTRPYTEVRVEIFRNTNGCTYGAPEAREFVAARTFVTDKAGNGYFEANIAVSGELYGDGITATATSTDAELGSNTSEISPCVPVRAPEE